MESFKEKLNSDDEKAIKDVIAMLKKASQAHAGQADTLSKALNEIDGLKESPDASLKKKADKTGIPFGILKKVFNRGKAAWRTGHRPGTNPDQWGHARVNSFATKSKGTWGGADKDLASKVRGSK